MPHAPNPFQKSIISAIEHFLDQDVKNKNRNANFNRESNCLEFRLPRGTGSTFLCHYLANKYNCPVGFHTTWARNSFYNHHRNPTEYGINPICFSTMDLKDYCSFTMTGSKDRDKLVEAILDTKMVVFDVFRAYSENKYIVQMIRESEDIKFIMFQ